MRTCGDTRLKYWMLTLAVSLGWLSILSAEDNGLNAKQKYRSVAAMVDRLRALNQPLPAIQPGDWLKNHPEKKQTFRDYVESKPVTLEMTRNRLYIQPMGELSESEEKAVALAAEFLGIYFQCSTRVLPAISLTSIPSQYQRTLGGTQAKQIQTDYLLREKLVPILPADAVAILGLTNQDLWPGEGYNFVFGQAIYRERVGVWSLHRLTLANDSEATDPILLKRLLKVASHETGHMFSMPHCVLARCNMQGSNSLQESDRQPLYLCCDCEGKMTFATNANAKIRLDELLEFCKKHGLQDEAEHYEKAVRVLR